MGFEIFYEDSQEYISFEKPTTDDSHYEVSYMYFSKAAKITGTYSNTNEGVTFTETYNIDAKAGWNKVYMSSTRSGNTSTQTATTDLSKVPSDLKWTINRNSPSSGDGGDGGSNSGNGGKNEGDGSGGNGDSDDRPALTINNVAGNTTVRITTQTISTGTVFDNLTGVVATGQGTYPLLTWAGETLTGTFNVMLRLVDNPNTVKFQNGVQFTNGSATVNWNTMTVISGNGDGPSNGSGNGGSTLNPDIDSALIGTWVDQVNGTILTITFTSTGITWGGTSGNVINTSTGAYQGSGYTSAWIAKDGAISLYYTYMGTTASYKAYDYAINSQGQLELKVGGVTFLTLVKQ
jgi:hypothetical protein